MSLPRIALEGSNQTESRTGDSDSRIRFSPNAERIWCVAAALEAGMVGINSGLIPNETAPFGGIKQSGLGRGVDQWTIRSTTAGPTSRLSS
ncbi:aldehyde dehydrogenase family protein [Nocardia farcinica]|uniref:aldehyde dehydrogenase family protein n=1 Tax=Nocardia farcinica TaxID=37329 RepID=UPI002B4B8733|nr:aldehyde dehydrogenase family protein [Nocardia farcinica]